MFLLETKSQKKSEYVELVPPGIIDLKIRGFEDPPQAHVSDHITTVSRACAVECVRIRCYTQMYGL